MLQNRTTRRPPLNEMRRSVNFNRHIPSVAKLHQCIYPIPAPKQDFLLKIVPGGNEFAHHVILQFGFGMLGRDESVATLFLEGPRQFSKTRLQLLLPQLPLMKLEEALI